MGSLSTHDWNYSKEKNFKLRSKKKSNSKFDDEFEEDNYYPQLSRYKKEDNRMAKRSNFKGGFDQA